MEEIRGEFYSDIDVGISSNIWIYCLDWIGSRCRREMKKGWSVVFWGRGIFPTREAKLWGSEMRFMKFFFFFLINLF